VVIEDVVRTGGARERVPSPVAVLGDVVHERQVLVHRPRPPPELPRLHLLLLHLSSVVHDKQARRIIESGGEERKEGERQVRRERLEDSERKWDAFYRVLRVRTMELI
jgi:hypothetical protein